MDKSGIIFDTLPNREELKQRHTTVVRSCRLPSSRFFLDRDHLGSQFVAHMSIALEHCADVLASKFVVCEGVVLLGEEAECVFERVRGYARALAELLNGIDEGSMPEEEFVFFAICAIAFYANRAGSSAKSLFYGQNMASHLPSSTQDAAMWTLLRSVLSVTAAEAEAAAALFETRRPKLLALCGMLVMLIRTEAADALLLSAGSRKAEEEKEGMSLFVEAAHTYVDPRERRTVLDFVLSSGYARNSSSRTSRRMCRQMDLVVDQWRDKPSPPEGFAGEEGLLPINLQLKTRSIYRLARSGYMLTGDGGPWLDLVVKANLVHESTAIGEDGELDRGRIQFWEQTWQNMHYVLSVSGPTIDRHKRTSAVVVWFYCGVVLYAFGRMLVPHLHNKWAMECSDTLEARMKTTLQECRREPNAPQTAMQARKARKRMSCKDRWLAATLVNDDTSEFVMRRVRDALERARSEDDVRVCQGAFTRVSSVAVVSF